PGRERAGASELLPSRLQQGITMSAHNLIRRLMLRAFRTPKTSPTRRPPRPAGLRIEQLEDRTVPSQIGLEASDQLVNNVNTTGDQGVPKVAMKPDGSGFVVVWEGPDGGGGASDLGVY